MVSWLDCGVLYYSSSSGCAGVNECGVVVGKGMVGSFELAAVGFGTSSSSSIVGFTVGTSIGFWCPGNWTFCFFVITFAFAFGGFSSESCDTCLCLISILSGSVMWGSSELESSGTGCIIASMVSSGFENGDDCAVGNWTSGVDGGIDGGGCGGNGGCPPGGGFKCGSSMSKSLSSCSPESFALSGGMFISSSGGGPWSSGWIGSFPSAPTGGCGGTTSLFTGGSTVVLLMAPLVSVEKAMIFHLFTWNSL